MSRVEWESGGAHSEKMDGQWYRDEFNSDDHYICYCGHESLRRNGVAIIVKKESKMQYLDAIS